MANGSLIKQRKHLLTLTISMLLGVGSCASPNGQFGEVDADGDMNISKTEAKKAGLTNLVQSWPKADKDNDDVLSKNEFEKYQKSHDGAKPDKKGEEFSKVDADGDKNISKHEAKKAGMTELVNNWDSADKDNDSVLTKKEFKAYQKKHGGKKFSKVDTDNDKNISKNEAKKAGMTKLVKNWSSADTDNDNVLSKKEFEAYQEKPGKPNKAPDKKTKSFTEVDANGDGQISKEEAKKAGLTKLLNNWASADKDGNGTISKKEYKSFKKKPKKSDKKKKTFSEVDKDGNNQISKEEAKKAGMSKLLKRWSSADKDGNGVLSKQEFKSYQKKHGKSGKPYKPFDKVDADNDGEISREEARAAGLENLVQKWQEADENTDAKLEKQEYTSFMKKHHGPSTMPQKSFQQVDANNDKEITKEEARKAGLTKLVKKWSAANKDNNQTLSESEFSAFMKAPGEDKASAKAIGVGKFESPETVLWDEKADVYLVSNINGMLTAADSNGFISRVSPDGTILDLKWIDGTKPEVALHGPKGMIFHGQYLIVADVGAVRFFDRNTSEPRHAIMIPDAYMLNDPAIGPDGNLYVSDTGSKVADPPGAVYRVGEGDQQPVIIAQGIDYDRPDGLIPHGNGLLVAPFEAHAKELYELSLDGRKSSYASLPQPKLDGLLRLPDDSLVVTSWKGKSVYHLVDKKPKLIASGIPSPAQIGYDAKRGRLLIPVLRENKVLIYPLDVSK
jgi:Ca2+-binding EF-hand superfamily protein